MKKKVVILLLSMMLFMGVFLYGAFQNIEKPEKEKKPPITQPSAETVLENVWIVSGENSEVTYFNEDQTVSVKTAMSLSEPIKNVIGDITMKDGIVQKIKLKPERISGKVISIDKDIIQIEVDDAIQNYPLADSFKVYRIRDGLKSLTIQNILVGYDNVDFALGDGKLCAGIVEKELEIHDIRVLLKTSKYEDILHQSVTFTCTSAYHVKVGKKTISNF